MSIGLSSMLVTSLHGRLLHLEGRRHSMRKLSVGVVVLHYGPESRVVGDVHVEGVSLSFQRRWRS